VASPAWIAANTDKIMATLERLYSMVATGAHPGAPEFLDRLEWLPPLLADLDRAASLDG
jgi:hypothetical protein